MLSVAICRPVCRHALSETLQKRIRAHEGNRSKRGLCCQLVVGLCLPAGLLTQGEWDYDRQARALLCDVGLDCWAPHVADSGRPSAPAHAC